MSAGDLRVRAVPDGVNKNGTEVNIDHYHDVVVTRFGVVREFSCLISEDGVPDIMYIGEDAMCFVASELA